MVPQMGKRSKKLSPRKHLGLFLSSVAHSENPVQVCYSLDKTLLAPDHCGTRSCTIGLQPPSMVKEN